jgi:alkane 1-monooxygenase
VLSAVEAKVPADRHGLRFALAAALPLGAAAAAWRSPFAAWLAMLLFQLGLALLERVPALQASPAAAPPNAWHRSVLRLHVLWQALLFGVALWVLQRPSMGWGDAVLLGLAVGAVSGAQGITFAHELGHSRSRLDRTLGWLLMGSVLYAHFMVEHYRGHHVRVATHDDPASARYGESLWTFLPRTLAGSWRSAWALEARRLDQVKRGWRSSPLAWSTAAQVTGLLIFTAWLGPLALLFWAVQAVYAVFQLETINYIEHYGLQRAQRSGRPEPFGMQHAWNADHVLTNCFVANLQRHSDHHLHAWKPYPTLEPLPGPQLPTGYAGCIYLATLPRAWFAVMHPRLAALR